MDRGHRDKALLQHAKVPFAEFSERALYARRFKAAVQSAEPKIPPKLSRDLVFEAPLPPPSAQPAPALKPDFSEIFERN